MAAAAAAPLVLPRVNTNEEHARINALLLVAASPPPQPLRTRTRAEVRAALHGGEQRYEAAISGRYTASRGAGDLNYVDYRVGNRRAAARDLVVWVDGSMRELRGAFARVRAAANSDDDNMARFTLLAELAGYAPSLFWSCATYAAAKTAGRSTTDYIQVLDNVVFDCMAEPAPASALVPDRTLAALDAALLLGVDSV